MCVKKVMWVCTFNSTHILTINKHVLLHIWSFYDHEYITFMMIINTQLIFDLAYFSLNFNKIIMFSHQVGDNFR